VPDGLRPEGAGASTGATVRIAIGSVISACGSQISMFFGWLDSPVKRIAPGSPGAVSKRRAAMSRVSVLPPGVLARPAMRPSMSRS
jgi:hypothetical protein